MRQEVSRSHSTLEIRADELSGGLTTKGRTERILVLTSQRNVVYQHSLGKAEQVKTKRMIERVLHPHNVQRAFKQVIANKGSAGVDRLSVNELTESYREATTHLYSPIK